MKTCKNAKKLMKMLNQIFIKIRADTMDFTVIVRLAEKYRW